MKKTDTGATKYVEPSKSASFNVHNRRDDNCSIVVHVPGDHNGLVDTKKYFRGFIEKKLEMKYRRFSFSASDLIQK